MSNIWGVKTKQNKQVLLFSLVSVDLDTRCPYSRCWIISRPSQDTTLASVLRSECTVRGLSTGKKGKLGDLGPQLRLQRVLVGDLRLIPSELRLWRPAEAAPSNQVST